MLNQLVMVMALSQVPVGPPPPAYVPANSIARPAVWQGATGGIGSPDWFFGPQFGGATGEYYGLAPGHPMTPSLPDNRPIAVR